MKEKPQALKSRRASGSWGNVAHKKSALSSAARSATGSAQSSSMEEAMGKMDIPIIRVESDYNEEDVEQLRIRIEAFIELIKLKELKKEA